MYVNNNDALTVRRRRSLSGVRIINYPIGYRVVTSRSARKLISTTIRRPRSFPSPGAYTAADTGDDIHAIVSFAFGHAAGAPYLARAELEYPFVIRETYSEKRR